MNILKKIGRALKKKSIIFLLIIIVLASTCLLVARSLSKPAIGVIKPAENQSAPEEFPLRTFENKYFTTKYSSRYELQENKSKSASLMSWMLIAHQSVGGNLGSKIVVIVTDLPAGGAKEDGAYKRFAAYPKLFTITNETYNMEAVIIATRTEGEYEQTALWAHGKYLFTFSMTAQAKTDQLTTEFDTFLSNMTWPES